MRATFAANSILLCSLLCAPPVIAQNGSLRVSLPAPTAATLGKFGDVPVALYTGVPDISIPLLTAKGKTLELPIVLKYHASGIRVEEIGGWVGIGWTLEAGGTITRTVRGLLDESSPGYYNQGHTWYNSANWPDPPVALLDNVRNGQLDGEPDQFFFSFAGRAGQFVMGPTSISPTLKEIRTIPYQKLGVTSTGTVGPFVITTEDGTQYTFNTVETSAEWNVTSDGQDGPDHGIPYPSSWQLSEIRSPGGDVITLYYSSYTARHRVGKYSETFQLVAGQCPLAEYWVNNEFEAQIQKLDSIKTSIQTVHFTVNDTLRTDALSPTGSPQERRLQKITLTTPSGTVLRVFQFAHNYSTGRLTLASVAEQDRTGASLPPSVFSYDPQPLPAYSSMSQDHWGFYNGKSNSSLLPPVADRRPDLPFARAGTLTKITYPTGAYNELTYEANDYGAFGPGASPPVGEGPPQNSSLYWEWPMVTQTTTFTVGGTTPVTATLTLTFEPANCEPGADDGCPITEIVGKGTWDSPGTHFVQLEPATYTMKIHDNASQGFATMNVEWRDIGPLNKVTGGGLRISQIKTVDPMDVPNAGVRKYDYTLQSDPTQSSGIVDAEPDYDHFYESSSCDYISRSSTSKMPLGAGTPAQVGYREVTVLHGATGQYGKTRHTFRSVTDAPDDPPYSLNHWPHARRTSREWKRGQQRDVIESNANTQRQQRGAATYAFLDESENLVLYSEDFENAPWTTSNATVSPNATLAPNWSQTADRLTEQANLATHGRFQGFSYVPGNVLFASLSVKAAERTKSRLFVGSGNAHFWADFDLLAGTVVGTGSNSNANGQGVVLGAEIVNEGGGWWRLRVTGKVTGTITTLFFASYMQVASGQTNYQGDGVSGLYVWGAAVNQKSWAYVPTTTSTSTTHSTTRAFRGMATHPFSSGLWGSNYYYNPFEVISAWFYQDRDTLVVYDTTGTSSFSTAKSFVYSNPNHIQLAAMTETNSGGTQRITQLKYPADYSTGSGDLEAGALTAMQGSAHIHSPVIERWVVSRVPGGPDSVLQAGITSFKMYGAGQYLPYRHFTLSSASGVTDFVPSFVTVTGGFFTRDSRYVLQETANTYDPAGRITELADPRGKLTTYQYLGGPNNNLLSQVRQASDPGGQDIVANIAYDTDWYVSSISDAAGAFRYFLYDTFGRLTHIKNHPDTVVSQFAYAYSRTLANGWVFQTATPNAVTTTTNLRHGPTVSVVSTEYLDGLGRSIQRAVQDVNSFTVTATQYDAMGRPWRVWKPYRRSPPISYDPNFATTATTNYNTYLGVPDAKPYVETQYRTDALGRVSKVIPEYVGASPPFFMVTAYGINAGLRQQITEVTDESLKKRQTFVDVFGNTVKIVLGAGAPEATTTQLFHNVLGQRTKATDPRSLSTTYSLDTRGLLTSKASPDAGTVTHKYDKAGNLRYTQDANQAAAGTVYFTSYDFANRPLVSGLGTASFENLDPNVTNPFETTDANWLVVRAYDVKPTTGLPWNRFTTQITTLTLNNVMGRLAAVGSKSNGAWQVTLFSYDAHGQVATRYTYTEANGGASVLTAVNTTESYTRDLRGALTQRSITVGSSTFYHWYEYNSRGQLWKVFASSSGSQPGTPDVTYTYRPSEQVHNRQFAGGPLVPLRYTIREQLQSIGDPGVTTYPFSARYTYNPNQTLLETEFYSGGSPATEKRYKYWFGEAPYYDALNRLKGGDFTHWSGGAWSPTAKYDLGPISYDPSGNLLTLQRRQDAGAVVDNLTYTIAPNSNRLTSVSEAVDGSLEAWDAEDGGFTYDLNGNMKTATGAPYSITTPIVYDHQNLPLSITRGTTTTYRYNAAGQRITKQGSTGDTEVYLLDGATSLGVFAVNSGGGIASSYFNVLAGDKVVGRQQIQPTGTNRRFYHTDLLGSTRSVTDGVTGAVFESYDFEPWGLLMPGRTLGSGTKEGFTGKEQDAETGLDYFGARYYMPALARWTAVDPLAEKHPEWSPYNYVLNNPAALIDPDGRQVPPGMAYYQYRLARFRARQDEQARGQTNQEPGSTEQEGSESNAGAGPTHHPVSSTPVGEQSNGEGLAVAAVFSVTAWDNLSHVIDDHLLRGTPSQFRDMSHEALKRVIDVTVRRFDGMIERDGRLIFERVWKGGIGTRREQIVRVVTTLSGELVTAFPVRNPIVLRFTGAVAGVGFSRLGKFARTAAGGAILGAGAWLVTSPTPIACQAIYTC